MNNIPRLLRYDNEYTVPTEVVTDMQADKILPATVTEILRCPCKKSNIKARQELFANMQKGDLAKRMYALLSALCGYDRLLREYRKTKNEFERIYLQIRVLNELCHLYDLLSAFGSDGELFSAAAKFHPIQTVLHNDMSKIHDILKKAQSLFFSVADKMWITPSSDIPTYKEKLINCASLLSLTTETAKKTHPEPVSPSIAMAMFELYNDEFWQINEILGRYNDIDLDGVKSYIPELEFYLGIHQLIQKAKSCGISYTFPKISDSPCYEAVELFDISLLAKNVVAVSNDAYFTTDESLFFLTGANGGGKTTYARAVGLNLMLFLSGCPIFAKSAKIYPFSALLTHFSVDERFNNTGRLDEEYDRAEKMLTACIEPFMIFNETFSGTDDTRGYELLLDFAEKIKDRNYFGLYITHFHEIEQTKYPILCAEIDEANNNERTYRIHRLGAKHLSFAEDILKKYRLDKESLDERLAEI